MKLTRGFLGRAVGFVANERAGPSSVEAAESSNVAARLLTRPLRNGTATGAAGGAGGGARRFGAPERERFPAAAEDAAGVRQIRRGVAFAASRC